MNKALVEKLAVQSLVWVDTGLADGREQIFSTTKFAELIVRECIGCCEQVISDPVPKSIDTFEQGGIHCMDEIKLHFGVEE